jgi:2-haloacid dehalogenase
MSRTSWIVFDVYGTLLDIESAAGRDPSGLTAIWRAKQLEYTWTTQAMGPYRDFRALTADALDYAIAATGASDARRDELSDAFLRLEPFPEVGDVLSALKGSARRLAVLSNGTAPMLAGALERAGISPYLDEVISVDEIRTYKPDPRTYTYAVERLGAETAQIRFASANAWDAAGARQAGLEAVWINRTGRPAEYGMAASDGVRHDLRRLLTLTEHAPTHRKGSDAQS